MILEEVRLADVAADGATFLAQTFPIADNNHSTVFTLSGGGTVVLTGMSSTTMDASDFV